MIRLPTNIDLPRKAHSVAMMIACVATIVPHVVWAEPTPTERNLASALFEQGRTLMSEGKIDEACVKLAESQRLDPGGGTLLNVALCHARQGRHATALLEFREARSIARKDGRADRESAAEGEITKLEALVSKVSVIVPAEAKIAGLVILIDGSALPEAAWSTPFPVDPGKRVITANAPGYREWSSTLEVGPTAGTSDINVPKLEVDPNYKPAGQQSGSSSDGAGKSGSDVPGKTSTSSLFTAGIVVGSLGVASLGASAVFAVLATQARDSANEVCPIKECGDAGAIQSSKDAFTNAHISTATFGIGVAGLAAGAIMIAVAPKRAPAKVSVFIAPQFISVTGKF